MEEVVSFGCPGESQTSGIRFYVTKMMDFILKVMDFVSEMMDFVFKLMSFVLQMMDFVFKMMDCVLKMMDCVLKMMTFADSSLRLPRRTDGDLYLQMKIFR